jgi:hypothetical protein
MADKSSLSLSYDIMIISTIRISKFYSCILFCCLLIWVRKLSSKETTPYYLQLAVLDLGAYQIIFHIGHLSVLIFFAIFLIEVLLARENQL